MSSLNSFRGEMCYFLLKKPLNATFHLSLSPSIQYPEKGGSLDDKLNWGGAGGGIKISLDLRRVSNRSNINHVNRRERDLQKVNVLQRERRGKKCPRGL